MQKWWLGRVAVYKRKGETDDVDYDGLKIKKKA